MRKVKKILAAVLCASMVLGMTACGEKTTDTDATPTPAQGNAGTETPGTETPGTNTPSTGGTNNEIVIGSWWYKYYDSHNENMDASPDWVNAQDAPDDSEEDKATNAKNRNICQLKWDNVTKIEQKYGVEFWWENLTYAGVTDSINVSILAGAPDCDIYLVDAGMAVPAQVNGLAVDLKTVLPADHDLFTEQKVAAYYDLGDGKACIFYDVAAETKVANTYPLGFNMQMLEDNNLEDPRELYARGEWTWDKFIEYCQALTQDTDGDGQNDQWGYCGYVIESFRQLMLSNGGNIAKGTTEGMSSAPVGETLQMLQDMYLTYNVCAPYDFEGEASNSMRNFYREGTVGFFPTAVWIQNGNGDYSPSSPETHLTWDTAYVQWPVGPSGNQETNAHENDVPSGAYIIPAGIEDPEKVFNVMYDFMNWFDGDTSLRDDKSALNWWYVENAFETELQEANFAVMEDMGSKTTFDLYEAIGLNYDFTSILNGTMTPAQFQETYKQQVQDALDSYFGG